MFLSPQQAHKNAMEILRHSDEASQWKYTMPAGAEAQSDSESEVESETEEN